MNIGVDAYYLFSQKNTGIGSHVLNLLNELSKIDTQNHYFLYTPIVKNIKYHGSIIANPNFQVIEVNNFLKKSRRLWLQHFSLIRQIKKDKIDFFLGSGEYLPILLPSYIKKAIIIYDVVFKIFPETVSFINKLFYNTLFRYCLHITDFIFTISNNSRKEIVQHLNPGDKTIFTIPCGIDLKKYLYNGKIIKKNYILFVGTLQPRKNLINLLKAYIMIHEQIKEKLVIVGASGWKNSNLVEFIEGLPKKTRYKIEFKGYIDDKELLYLYRKAKIFVAPSIHEGFGLIILESLASGTPVITTKTGAIPEFFSNAVKFVDPLSPEDIAYTIQKIIKDKIIQTKMIQKGLITAKKYSLKIMAIRYLTIFNEIDSNQIKH